ncbi:MAG: hypothetical protein K2L11_04195, partial [Muribaculaceae bacterium]|nr:hypothetical protein [Muribaculaceae bacterium]
FVFYANDDPLTLDSGDYGLEESIEEIPWTFENNNMTILKPFGTCRHAVYVFVEGISTIGVQSVYRYDGKETRSEIVTIDVENDPDAVGTIDADKKIADVKYYSIDGREVAAPASGLFIKRVIFDDGATHTSKLLR